MVKHLSDVWLHTSLFLLIFSFKCIIMFYININLGDFMKNKIIISALCVLLCLLTAVTIISATAATFVTDSEWKLEIASDTEYYIEEYLGKETTVTIPETIGNKKVTKINSQAFASSKVIEVMLPDTVTIIDSYAFFNCKTLKSVTASENITSIGSGAFANCTVLESVDFAENALFASIPGSCFTGCTALKEIKIPQGVINIYDYAFLNCNNLTKVEIPESVINIANKAFNKADNITLYVYDGSYALQYAIDNNIPYVNLGVYVESTEPTTAPTTATEPSEVVSSVVTEPTEVSTPDEPTTPVTTPSTTVTEPTEETSATASEPTETTVVMKLLYFMGDADLDYRVTIKDATKIQKHLAKISELNEIQLILADVDENSSVSVKDATKIQKFLAGFADISVVGSEVYL